MNKEIEKLTNRVIKLSGIDIFKNTREKKYVEARSLLIFLLYNTKNYKLADIEKYFKSKGKNYNHATVLYALRNFDTYRLFNKNINVWLNDITNIDSTTFEKRSIIIQNIKALRKQNINKLFIQVNEMYEKQTQPIDIKF